MKVQFGVYLIRVRVGVRVWVRVRVGVRVRVRVRVRARVRVMVRVGVVARPRACSLQRHAVAPRSIQSRGYLCTSAGDVNPDHCVGDCPNMMIP